MSLSKENNDFKQTSATEDSLKFWQQELINEGDASKIAKSVHLGNSFKINKEALNSKQTRNDNKDWLNAKQANQADDKDLDYREALRRSLEIGSKKSQNVNVLISNRDEHEDDSDQQILSAESSEHESESFHKPEYLMSPLNEDYEDFEEFNSKLQKSSAKIIDEYNNMHQEQYEFIQQFSDEIKNGLNEWNSVDSDNKLEF